MTAEWQQPTGYRVGTDEEFEQLAADTGAQRIIDPIEQIADDLYEYENPGALDDEVGRQAYKAALLEAGPSYGTWFHYNNPDSRFQGLVRYAPRDVHYALRTSRNRPLITDTEQPRLGNSTIAVIGLSVGSQAIPPMVQMGIGSRYQLFDTDTVSVANLNRLNGSYFDVGRLKTSVSGDEISSLDPYVRQEHYTEGYTRETAERLRENRPDAIIEEVDSMPAKAHIRSLAAELGIPIVMAGDVDDKSVFSVERHDREKVKPFNGKLSEDEFERLLADSMSEAEQAKMLAKIIGLTNVSMRLLGAVPEIGKSIAGMPQLGSSAAVGGVLDAVAVRDILLDRGPKSGISVVDIRGAVGSKRTSSVSEGLASVQSYLKHVKASRQSQKQ